jgi:protein phosphatase
LDKIAVISDIHGNMPALETVLADIKQRGIELIYNLGDLVGKGPNSDQVVDRCREVCQVTVRGNWDDGIQQTENNPLGAFVRQQIGEERTAYLRDLPNVYDFWLSGKRIRLYHASQKSVYHRIYSWDTYEIHREMFENTEFTGFDQPEPDIVGYGDIHSAYTLALPSGQKIIFNAGSVGNPLDLPLATYAILNGTLDNQTPGVFSFDFIRLPYDIEKAVEDARDSNMPGFEAYANELRTAVYRGRPKSSS